MKAENLPKRKSQCPQSLTTVWVETAHGEGNWGHLKACGTALSCVCVLADVPFQGWPSLWSPSGQGWEDTLWAPCFDQLPICIKLIRNWFFEACQACLALHSSSINKKGRAEGKSQERYQNNHSHKHWVAAWSSFRKWGSQPSLSSAVPITCPHVPSSHRHCQNQPGHIAQGRRLYFMNKTLKVKWITAIAEAPSTFFGQVRPSSHKASPSSLCFT